MKRFGSTRKRDANIPTASMADIAFLLIIFFMVTTVHEVDRTKIDLPASTVHVEADKGAAIIVLEVTPEGDYVYHFSDGKEMSNVVPGIREIYLEATRIVHLRGKLWQFLIKADGQVHFEKVDELLDTLRRAGTQTVLLLTQPSGP